MGHLIALYIGMQLILENENGATMIEYALMVAFIAMVAFAAVVAFGNNLNAKFASFSEMFP